jgi:hypothetical protein
VVTSLSLPLVRMPSKLQNVLGLAFQTLSMALIGTIKLLAVPDQMWIVCLGLVIQGIASPCIAISVMPSVIYLNSGSRYFPAALQPTPRNRQQSLWRTL